MLKRFKIKTTPLLLCLFCLLLLTNTPLTAVAQGGEWVKRADTPKAGGLGEAVVGTGDYIYAIRGYSTGKCQFWRYDPATDSWTTLMEWNPDKLPFPPPPRPKSGTALAWDHGDLIYALLGAAYTNPNRTYFYCYNISADSWKQLANTTHSQGAGNAITWSGYDDMVYAILGSREHGTNFTRYNPSGDSWETLTFNPNWTVTDDGASLVWTGGEYLYTLSGEWEETTPHNDFARYHITDDSWEDLTPIPENEPSGGGRGVGDGASLLWIGNWISEYSDYIFALGGGGVLEELGNNSYRYRISNDKWTKMEDLPCPVGYWVGNRLGFTDGHIYYWQGAPTTKPCGGDTFYMFNMPTFTSSDSPVGGEVYSVNKLNLLTPWIVCVVLLIYGVSYPLLRRRGWKR